jgi:hypothetical protein
MTPHTVADFADVAESLLTLCPELLVAWQANCELTGDDKATDTDIYNVIETIVLPALGTLLSAGRDSGFEDMYPGTLPRTEIERQDLTNRIYIAIDLWAGSPNVTIREATFLEFVAEGGWGPFIDADSLLRQAGPNLRALAERQK